MTVICIADDWLHIQGEPPKLYPEFMRPYTVSRTACIAGLRAYEFLELGFNCWFVTNAFAISSNPATISILKNLNLKDEKPDTNTRNMPDPD